MMDTFNLVLFFRSNSLKCKISLIRFEQKFVLYIYRVFSNYCFELKAQARKKNRIVRP